MSKQIDQKNINKFARESSATSDPYQVLTEVNLKVVGVKPPGNTQSEMSFF